MLIFLWLGVLCVFSIGQTLGAGCDQLLISGTEHRDDLAGVYENRYSQCNGRNTYKQRGGPNFLFYNDIGEDHWAVSTDLCSEEISMGVFDTAQYPEDIVEVWQEYPGVTENDDWQKTYGLSVNCYSGLTGCTDVSILNADHGHSGKYTVRPDLYCYGRNTYKHSSKNYYLYNYLGTWVIGDSSCNAYGYIRAQDGAQYPEDVREVWEESLVYDDDFNTDGDWYTSDINCKCYSTADFVTSALSLGAIIGIAVGGIVVLIIIIAVSVVCCKKKSTPRSQPTQAIPMTSPGVNQQVAVAPPAYPGQTQQVPFTPQAYPGNQPQQLYPANMGYVDPNLQAQQGYGNPAFGLK